MAGFNGANGKAVDDAQVADPSEESAKQRTNYYDKWHKVTKVELERVKTEEEKEAEEASKKLGIDPSQPKSEAEKRDKEKHEALKEAKKQWDQRQLSEASMKHAIEGHDGEEIVFDSKLLKSKPVLVFKNNKNSKYKLPHNLAHRIVKVFLENCSNCIFDFEVELITQHVESSWCKDCIVNIKAPLATLQLDLCERLTVKYAKGLFIEEKVKIFHAGVRQLKVETHDGHYHETDYFDLGAAIENGKTAEEQQFVTHLFENKLHTEKVVRDKGNMPATKRELDGEERTTDREAELKKIGGNEAFKDGEYAQAAIFYTEAIELAPSELDPATGKPVSDIRHVCYANRAFCFQKLGHHEKAEEDARKCIEIEPDYVKGLFRLGLALHARKKYHEAIPVLARALKLQPKNDQIKQALGFAELKARKAAQGL